MTWTYNGDPASSALSAIRFLIGDTDTADQLVTDEEIAWLNTESGDTPTSLTALYKASAAAARAIAAKFSRLADQSVGDLKVSMSQKAVGYDALARSLAAQAAADAGVPIPFAGGISVADKTNREADTDRVEPFFKTNQFSNTTDPGAGLARAQ
tara:strand:+ start:196 stop:657 length:462 start_codon:yes stop_codon:yes gene_type:complete